MSGFLSAVFQPLRCLRQGLTSLSTLTPSTSLVQAESFSLSTIRTNVRCYFPRPNEVKRVRRHGYKARMSTPNGRKIIMKKILKGRFVLSH